MSSAAAARFRLRPGETFRAKWSGAHITVERKLGEGANGSVYLVRSSFGPSYCALKTGSDAYVLQSEINALKAIGQNLPPDSSIRNNVPKLILADDGTVREGEFPFYLMTYFRGSVLSATTIDGPVLLTCGSNLLHLLNGFHRAGWVFGDLKTDNILVTPDGQTQLVDYGGTTRFGHAVKQFTELYDRGFWRAGGRKAEPSYDLFSFAVVMLEAAGNGTRLRAAASAVQHRNRKTLISLVDATPSLQPVAQVLKKMIMSEYDSAEQAYQGWRNALNGHRSSPSGGRPHWVTLWFAAALVSCSIAVWRAW